MVPVFHGVLMRLNVATSPYGISDSRRLTPRFLLALCFAAVLFFGCAPSGTSSTDKSAKPVSQIATETPDTRFRSVEGKFAVAFPTSPGQSETTKTVLDAPTKVSEFHAATPGGEQVFFVSYFDYPSAILESRQPYQLLWQVMDAILQSDNLKLVRKSQTMIYESDGTCDFDAEGVIDGQDVFFANRIVVQGNRLYQVSAVYGVEQKEQGRPSDAALEFLDSFELLEKKPVVRSRPNSSGGNSQTPK